MAFFLRNIELDKPQGTISKGQEGVFTLIVQMIRSFLWDLRSRKKQTFEKIAVFTMTKALAHFRRFIECEKSQETTSRGP